MEKYPPHTLNVKSETTTSNTIALTGICLVNRRFVVSVFERVGDNFEEVVSEVGIKKVCKDVNIAETTSSRVIHYHHLIGYILFKEGYKLFADMLQDPKARR